VNPAPRPREDDRYTFNWQEQRDEDAAWGAKLYHDKTGCDAPLRWKEVGRCRGGPHALAALAGDHRNRVGKGVRIAVDRGSADAVNTDWEAALLDDDGHPVSGWGKVTKVLSSHECEIVFDISLEASNPYTHVGMRLDLALQESHFPTGFSEGQPHR